MEWEFYLTYTPISLLMIVGGILIRKYFKKMKLEGREILSSTIYWYQFYSWVLIIMGSLALLSIVFTFYYDIKY